MREAKCFSHDFLTEKNIVNEFILLSYGFSCARI